MANHIDLFLSTRTQPYNEASIIGSESLPAIAGDDFIAIVKKLKLGEKLRENHSRHMASLESCVGWCSACVAHTGCGLGCLECIAIAHGCHGSGAIPQCKPALSAR